ncbi:hypothetical protein JKY72_03940 [Candidatus Gracilibacteria bacterium]|nr:hypothetical protein [Candidatus Gracilibacteria bacterium]
MNIFAGNWYHTPSSIAKGAKQMPFLAAEQSVIGKALKSGSFDHGDLEGFTLLDLSLIKAEFERLLVETQAMQTNMEVSRIKHYISERLLFLKALLALPLMPFIDEEGLLYRPLGALYSGDASGNLHCLSGQLESFVEWKGGVMEVEAEGEDDYWGGPQ